MRYGINASYNIIRRNIKTIFKLLMINFDMLIPAHDLESHTQGGQMLNNASDFNPVVAYNMFENFPDFDPSLESAVDKSNTSQLNDFVTNTDLLFTQAKQKFLLLKEEIAKIYEEKTGENEESGEKEKWIKKYIKTLPQRILTKEPIDSFTESEKQIIKEMFLYENRMQVFRYVLDFVSTEYDVTKIKMASGEILVDAVRLEKTKAQMEIELDILNKLFQDHLDNFDTHEKFAKLYGFPVSDFEGDVKRRSQEYGKAVEQLFLNKSFEAKVYAQLPEVLEWEQQIDVQKVKFAAAWVIQMQEQEKWARVIEQLLGFAGAMKLRTKCSYRCAFFR